MLLVDVVILLNIMDLQKLWTEYKDKGLMVIGIPTNNFKQEPGSNKEIKDFCETNFGINFPMTEKINVIGNKSHPFYKWAKKVTDWCNS